MMLSGANWTFLHIPKCGGNTVRHYLNGFEKGKIMPLGPLCPIRSPLHRVTSRRPTGSIFTVVRHPAAWIRSFWLDQSPRRIGVKRYLHRFWSDDLDQFAINLCAGHPGYVSNLYYEYTRFRGTKVFRLEDGLDSVFNWLGLNIKTVPVINPSPNGPQLNPDSLAHITEIEASALHLYGYADESG